MASINLRELVMDHKQLSLLELILFIIIAFTILLFVGSCPQKLRINVKKAQAFNNLKNIVISMQDYASSDTKFQRMPYPIAKGSSESLPAWGEIKDCWSPEIVKLLFKTQFLVKGNEGILVSMGVTGGEYEPLELSEDLEAGGNINKMRWETDAELHFHVYCEPNLTNQASGDLIMGITYDQPDINNSLFIGEGWIIFNMDGSGGWKKRKLYGQYDFDNPNDKLVDTIAKKSKQTLRKVFGVNGGGGSTELIGLRSDSKKYKAFVRE